MYNYSITMIFWSNCTFDSESLFIAIVIVINTNWQRGLSRFGDRTKFFFTWHRPLHLAGYYHQTDKQCAGSLARSL